MFRVLVLLAAAAVGSCGQPSDSAPAAAPAIQQTRVAAAWNLTSVSMYLPTSLTDPRLPASMLAGFLKEVRDSSAPAFAAETTGEAVSGTIVVVMKPGNRSRFWVVTGEPAIPEAAQRRILAKLEAISPPTVVDGPVVVGLNFDAWGGGDQPENLPTPIPDSWKRHLPAGGGYINDAFIEKVWEDG